MARYQVTERLYRTEDDRIVPEGHPDARWLYAIPGTEIPLEEAEVRGLVKPKGKAKKAKSKDDSKSSDKAGGDSEE